MAATRRDNRGIVLEKAKVRINPVNTASDTMMILNRHMMYIPGD